MFLICLLLALIVILILTFKHGRSKHKKLITVTVFMIMTGMVFWGYSDLSLVAGYPSVIHHNNVFNAVINEPIVWTIGMTLLILSIPCTLFCILSKPQKIEEIDKILEDQDDID